MARILIVDDHEVIRKGIIQILSSELPASVFLEAAHAVDALNLVWNEALNLVLLDVSLPGRGGMDLLKEIRSARPRLPVLVLSMHPEEQFATRALRAGASGYLNKGMLSETLVQAVRHVLAGGKYISAKTAELLTLELDQDASRAPHEQLSDRELDVLIRIATGEAVGEIAGELNLSVKTVSTYRTRILDKMGMKNNSELTRYAIRAGLVE